MLFRSMSTAFHPETDGASERTNKTVNQCLRYHVARNQKGASTSTTVFVSLANNVESENNDVKIALTSKNIDKGKFILGAPP